jgi:hypothetical protein
VLSDEPDLTAELDAAEEIVMGRAESVVAEWASREISPTPTESLFRYFSLSERTVRGILAARARRGRKDALYRRTVTYGPWEEVPDGG